MSEASLASRLFSAGTVDEAEQKLTKPALLNDMTRNIALSDIIDNPKNRAVSDEKVAEYAESILEIGMIEDPVVTSMDDGTFMILSGHHRIAACRKLSQTYDGYDVVRCKVMHKDEIDQELVLLQGNIMHNPLTAYEKMIAIGRQEELLRMKGERGTLRSKIAQNTGLKPTQVQTNLTIYKKATPEVKEALKEGAITLEHARELAVQNEDTQKRSIKETKEAVSIPLKNLLNIKKHVEKSLKESLDVTYINEHFPLMTEEWDQLHKAATAYSEVCYKYLDILKKRITVFEEYISEDQKPNCNSCEYCEDEHCRLIKEYASENKSKLNVLSYMTYVPYWCPRKKERGYDNEYR